MTIECDNDVEADAERLAAMRHQLSEGKPSQMCECGHYYVRHCDDEGPLRVAPAHGCGQCDCEAFQPDESESLTASEFTAHIAKAIQKERTAHAKTAKSQVDLISVLGCVHMRVKRFRDFHEPVVGSKLGEFVADLERMVGQGSPDPRLTTLLDAIETYGVEQGPCPVTGTSERFCGDCDYCQLLNEATDVAFGLNEPKKLLP